MSSTSLHNVSLQTINFSFKVISISPKIIEEIKPKERTPFTINVSVDSHTRESLYKLNLNITGAELASSGVKFNTKIHVVRKTTYGFYVICIFITLALLAWFIIRMKRIEKLATSKSNHQIQKKPWLFSGIRISTWRRISQVFFFLLLVYGGYLMLPQVRTDFLPFVQSDPNITKLPSLNAPQQYTEVFDTYTPFRTCRYMDGNRIFRACSVHYFTEVPAYGVPWYDFIPHFLVIVLLMFIFARVFCGWVCPLGSIQDFLGIFRKWIGLEHWSIPKGVMNVLKVLRIIWIIILFILAIAIALPLIGLIAFKNELFLIACQTCPARNIFPLISGLNPNWFPFNDPVLAIFSLIGIFFLILLALGFFGKRLWCRFCPNGIIQGWFNKGSLFSKEKDVRKCTKCGVCKRVCPMDNEYVFEEKDRKNVNNQDCIMCFSCVDKCPEDECLKVKFAGKEIARSKYKSPIFSSKYVPPESNSENIPSKPNTNHKHHKKSKK